MAAGFLLGCDEFSLREISQPGDGRLIFS